MKNLKTFITAMTMLICCIAFAQEPSVSEQPKQKTITGIVSDKQGPLPGAYVMIKGTKIGTQTDFDGKYSIKTKIGDLLVFQYIGFTNQTIRVSTSNVINVVLKESQSLLQEVVVVGYSKGNDDENDETYVRKRSVSSSTQIISAKEINTKPNPNAVRTLSGKVSGLQVGISSQNVLVTSSKGIKKPNSIKLNSIQIDTNDEYAAFEENSFENPKANPLSTFSIDVDNASYTNIRRFLNNGQTVPKDAVRVEEMMNFFKYQYPQPTDKNPFSINTEYSDCPWNIKHKIVKIGLQGKNIPIENLPNSNLVFLIDVSGSMDSENKLPLVIQSLKILVEQLREEDKISIVVYAGAAGMVLPPTSGDKKQTIVDALEKLTSGGSTAGGAGIELAYKIATENFIKNGNNRVILATDGDFNVGSTSDNDMQKLIEEKRKTGVFLTCLGYGMGNYKDSKMEVLADKGNGNYAYIDTIQEANRFLGKEFKGSMFAIAKDVKIQIEFNPKHVQSYRLIGYENRKLRAEDFKNDAIDAGELGSGHTVTALYEVIPTGIESEYLINQTDLKYTKTEPSATLYNDELATIKFRYKKPDGDKSIEMITIIDNKTTELTKATEDFKFSTAVAWFGLKLRDSKLITNKSTLDIKKLASEGLSIDKEGYKAEFIRLLETVN